MNKIFRVVWSHVAQSWVAVSELTKAHKKQSSSNAKKSASSSSANLIRSSAIVLSLLSGHSAYAALNDAGTGNGAVAWGTDSKADAGDSVAIGKGPMASGSYAVAIGASANAGRINAVAMGNQASATGDNATALGRAAKATQSSAVAIGDSAEATGDDTVAIGKESKATQPRSIAIGQTAKVNGGQDTVAIGTNAQVNNHKSIALGRDSQATAEFSMALGAQSQATATRAIALGTDAKAQSDQAVAIGSEASAVQPRSIAIGKYARVINGQDTVVIGTDTEAQGHGSIIIGKNAKTKNDAQGTVVIGRDAFSEGSGNTDRPNTVVGRGAYTAFGQNGDYRLNASIALGFQAGAGVNRESDNNRKLVRNETNADNNAEVLVKAGYALDRSAPANTKAAVQSGAVHNGLVFYRQNHINEGTALGVEARAVGDQSIAIGGQVVAGDGVVALGGNDSDALRDNKYQVVTDNAVRNTNVSTIDDYNLAYTESTNTVAGQYQKLVGRGMPGSYKSTYGQSGSVVIGMHAHSTTALGTAIGTNSVVRMGAFGATAIGAGSTVQPNAEAAVAIGMGSVANGAYALAAGTASWAELGDIAMGYKAKASGQQGAIAIGQATNAQGDSSVMIGGANISNAADQETTYEAERKNADGSRVTYTKDVTERINGQDVTRKYTYVSTETKNAKISDAYAELTGKTMNTASLDYNDLKNRNGHASTSIGVHSLAKGNLASAYGASSRASAIGSLALGTGAIADKQNAVAIGTGSTTDLTGTRQLDASYDKEGKWVASDSPNAAYTFKWAGGVNTSEGDVVSFGSSGAERQLKNVAAGRIAEDSTDAINGSQVNAVIERFIGERVKYFSVKSTEEPNRQNNGATGDNAIAIGPNASATKVDAVATGNGATATGDRATAYGAGTTASAVNAVAVGSTVTVTEGTTAKEVATKADAASATALGAGAQATAMNSTAVGTLSEAKEAEAIAIGSKAKSESVAGVAIGQNAQVGAAATQGLALGQNAAVSTVGGVALGTGSVASVAGGVSGIGVDGEAEGTARVNKYAKLHDNADNALTSGQGAVAIGGTSNNTPFTRQITGLAAGTNDTDAVNVAQLKSVNLAFKGNTGTGDVRLHDQRLTVESDNTDLLTVEASDKKLTLKPKTTALTVDSTAGSTTLGKVTVPTTNALVTAQDVANAINAAHWNVATEASTATGAKHEGDSTAAVHAGETVKFIAGEHVTIHQDGRNITVSMKDAVTNIMVKDQIQTSFEDGNNTTFTVNPATGKLRYDVSPTPTYTTITTGKSTLKDGAVTNLNDHLPKSDDPSVAKPNISSEGGTEAATVNDVLNAGWNLQNNGEARDFVKPYDTVNFVNGANTTAVVTTDGTTSKVTYNVTGLPVSYTTADGKPVSKVGDKYYTVDEKGNPVDLVDTTTNPLKSSLVNPNVKNTTDAPNNQTTTPTQLGNVANGGVTHNLRDANGTELKLANDGNYYDATKVNPDGSPMTGVTPADAKTPVVLANDGKWYPKDKVSDRGELKDPTATPVVPGITAASPTAGLVDFGKSNPNNVATIGDLRNMGWVVSAPTNGYLDQVRNANQVDFVGKNGVVVTGETKNGIRTITVETAEEAVVFKGPDGTSLIKTEKGYVPENSVKIDGNYYPQNTVKDPVTGNIVNNGALATPVTPVPREDVVTSMNSSTPKTLNNVKNTLPNVNDETKTITTPDGQKQPNAGDVSNINRAPLTAAQAAELSNPKTADGQSNPNYKGSNAATVSDVLNAGWNLETNSKALDFVKPYDTVNFADGGNTTVVSSTDGTTSKIQVNVTGLPVSNTVTDANGNQVPVTKVGNTYFPVKADGTPDIQRDDKGNPTNGYTIANDGNIYPSNQITFTPQADGTTTAAPQATAQPTTLNTNLVNPNVANGDPTKGVNAPTTLGNVNNGANTINPISTTGVPLKKAKDGKWYDATKVDEQGNTTPDAAAFEGTPAVLANDGRWYEVGKVDEKGTPKADAQPISNPLTNKTANGGLINFANSNPNNAATVGDLQNMGWIVGAPTNNYADQVRNANQVNFVGAHAAEVTGRTDDNGIRTITIDVNEQKTVETAHTPVVFTDKDGNKLTKLENGKFYDANAVKAMGPTITEEDGKLYPADAIKVDGKYYPADTIFIDGKPYPKGTVKHDDGTITNPKGLDYKEIEGIPPVTETKASMNTTEGSTTNPFPLANVGSNLKQVVDPKENVPGQVNDKDGETKVGDTTNKAPYTAKEAANLVQKYELNEDGTVKTEKVPVIDPETGKQKLDETGQPVTEDKKVLNSNYIGNNAATVSDVLNAGWNLQNNGEARDFVKPYDTVNFVNGANTTAVVTTSEDGTTSKVTFNVTGLPVAYTDADGDKVAKIGDKYYKVNDKGQPLDEQGQPSTKVNDKGVPVNADGQEIPSVNVANTSLVNPTPENGKTSTTSPTALNNVTSNLSNYTDKDVDGKAPAKNALRNLDNKDVSDNTAATVGDLRNMGWIVSSDKKTGDLGNPYSEAVKNANEVKFVGTGAAVVSGNTVDGVRTITVSVDNQVATNNSVTPVVYTDKEGNTVYPIKDDKGNVTYHTTPNGTGNNDSVVPNDQVNTSVNGPKDETTGKVRPASLGNVKNNIPTVNDADKKAYNVDGTPIADKNNTAAPITAADAADLLKPMKDGKANPNFVGNNAATVSDVLNTGWNLQGNGTNVDFVKPYDTVNFRDGGNTTVTVTTDDNLTSHVQVNVTGLPVSNTITDPATGKQVPVVKVGDAFYRANPDGTPDIVRNDKGEPTNGYVRANDGKLYPREDVTVTPAADPTQPPTITPKDGKTPTTVNTNLVNPNVDNTTDNPGNNVSTPTQLGNVANGAKTFEPVAADGTKLVQVGDKFYPADKVQDGQLKPGTDATADAKDPVKLANDGKWYKASEVEPNGKAKDGVKPLANPSAPKNADGDVLEKGNDGNWYKAKELTNGKPNNGATVQQPVAKPANSEKSGLIDFTNSNPNNAATVGDLQNLGFVVSAKDNSYTDQVRNASKVEFKGSNGIEVTGKTLKDGTREITVAIADGKVTDKVTITKDGKDIPAIKIGDNYYEVDKNGKPVGYEVDEKGKPTANNKPIDVAGATITNEGNKVVTGNTVATAIQESGWNVGLANTADADKAFNDADKALSATKLEKVNPNDNVRFADGKGTKAAVATVERVDEFGKKVTDTYVKFDVDAGEITAEKTKDGKATGKVVGLIPADKKPADLLKAVENAQKAVDKLAKDAAATPEAKQAAQDALKAAQDAAAPLNKVATAQNVADMINASGFTLKTSATADGKKESGDDEVINPGKAVEMVAGKNLTVKQEADGKVTYATKDDVSFNTVNVGEPETYKNAAGETVVKGNDGKFYKPNELNADGKPNEGATGLEREKVTLENPQVTLKREAAKEATNNDDANKPSSALNVSSSDGKPTQITGVGSTLNVKPVDTNTNGTPTADTDKPNLVDLVGTKDAPVNKNAAATVGDLQNMGWVVSTKDGNRYIDVVKNANQVDFKGTGLATVTGKTDKESGIRTITVNVDAQKTVEAAQTPVVYTNKAGDKLVKVDDKFYKANEVENGKPKDGVPEVPKGDVIASMNNGDNNTSKPMQLANIGSNLPTVNDTTKQAFDPNSTAPKADKNNKSAPMTAAGAAELLNPTTADGKANPKFAGNNAATVSDVLNAGWNLQGNGSAVDFVKPFDTVNFVNGKGTKAVVETADNLTSTVKFDVDAGEITAETKDGKATGKVVGLIPADKKPADLLKAVENAQKAVDKLAKDAAATPEAKQAAQDALKAAQDAAAPLNKVATAQNVADMINASGFTLKTSATADGKKESGDDEVINPGKAVEMVAGKNLTVKQEANGKVTYASKDDVQFNSVQFGGNTGPKITNNDGNINVSGPDGKAPTKITGVAAGEISSTSTDAINGSQLHSVASGINNRMGSLDNKIDMADRNLRGGVAQAIATAGLVQAYLPGKSLLAIGGGVYRGESGYAIGYSSISDGGNWIIKGTASGNSRGNFGASSSIGYQW